MAMPTCLLSVAFPRSMASRERPIGIERVDLERGQKRGLILIEQASHHTL